MTESWHKLSDADLLLALKDQPPVAAELMVEWRNGVGTALQITRLLENK